MNKKIHPNLVTVRGSGRTEKRITMAKFCENCGAPVKEGAKFCETCGAKIPVIAKPNAGMPTMDEHGIAHYDMAPDAFARSMKKLIWRGARIVGGCCGTDPDYIRALRAEIG